MEYEDQNTLFRPAPPPMDMDAVSKTRAYLDAWDAKHGAFHAPSRRALHELLELGDTTQAIVVINVMDTAHLPVNKTLRAWFHRLAVRYHRSNHFPSRTQPVLFVEVSATDLSHPENKADDGYAFVEACFRPRAAAEPGHTQPPYFSNTIYVSGTAKNRWAFKTRGAQVNAEAEAVAVTDVMALIATASPSHDTTTRRYTVDDLRTTWVRQGVEGGGIATAASDLDTLVDAPHARDVDTLECASKRFRAQYAALQAIDARRELTRFLPSHIRAVVYLTLRYGALPAAGLPLFQGIWNPEELPDAVLRRILTSDVLAKCVLVLPTDVLDAPNIPAVSAVRIDENASLGETSYLYGDGVVVLDELERGSARPTRSRMQRRAASHTSVSTSSVRKWTRNLSGDADPYAEVSQLTVPMQRQAKAWHAGRHRGLPAPKGQLLPFAMPAYERCVLSGPPTVTSAESAMVTLAHMRCNVAAIVVNTNPSAAGPVQATIAYMVTRNLVTDPFRYAFVDRAPLASLAVAASTNLVEMLLTVVCADTNDVQVFHAIYGTAVVRCDGSPPTTKRRATRKRVVAQPYDEHCKTTYMVRANPSYPCVYIGERRVGNTTIAIDGDWACLDDVALPLFFAVTRYESDVQPVCNDRKALGTFHAIAGPGPSVVDVLLTLRPPQVALSRAWRRLLMVQHDATENAAHILLNAQRHFEAWRRVIERYMYASRTTGFMHATLDDIPDELRLAEIANAATPAEFLKIALNKSRYLPAATIAMGGRRGVAVLTLDDKRFLVYGASWCPYTQKALTAIGLTNWTFVEVGNAADARHKAAQSKVKHEAIPTSHKTIPVVFEGGVFIGGATETLARLAAEPTAPSTLLPNADVTRLPERVTDPSLWSLAKQPPLL